MRLFTLLLSLLLAANVVLQQELYELTETVANLPFLFPHEFHHYLRIAHHLHTIPSDAYPGFRADRLRFEMILAEKPIESLFKNKKSQN